MQIYFSRLMQIYFSQLMQICFQRIMVGELRENPFTGHHVGDRSRTVDVELSAFVRLLTNPVVKNQILQDIEEFIARCVFSLG